MTFSKIQNILNDEYIDKPVSIHGWLYRTRSSGKLVFMVVRDSTNIVQVIVEKGKIPDTEFENATRARIESSVIVHGTVKKEPRAPTGYEIHATNVSVVHFAERFPITKDQSEEFLLDNRHLWLRSRELTTIMKVKASILKGAREWFEEHDFVEVTPPIITTNACEGGSTLFELNYFGSKAYLSQSAQMYLESLVFSLEYVWALTPSFRAEPSRTTRHLAEYSHLESEEAWTGFDENLHIQEALVTAIVRKVLEERKDELLFLKRDISALQKVEPPFKRITYTKAIDLLKEKGFDLHWGSDFGTHEEREISKLDDKPIFITHYPQEIKPFYMKINDENPKLVNNADLIAPDGFGEIIGGSERETDIESMIARLKKENAQLKNYEWYFDLRRFGSVQHSGFGLGIERVTRWICGIEHIRNTIPYPRTINRVYP